MPTKKKKAKSKAKNTFAQAASLANELATNRAYMPEEVPLIRDDGVSYPKPVVLRESVGQKKKAVKSKKPVPAPKKKQKREKTLIDVSKSAPEAGSVAAGEKKASSSKVEWEDGGVAMPDKPLSPARGGVFEAIGGLFMVLIIIEVIAIIVLLGLIFIK